ncbi:MAG: hypothetical protein HY344_00585 [Candidatus Levybacteria bacterium]|nr:hypothetical protein [Candidatus Levybacteria bacterium]
MEIEPPIQQLLDFCRQGRTLVTGFTNKTYNLPTGEQKTSYSFVLERRNLRSQLPTTLDVFNQARVVVSHCAWKLSETPQGRRLVENITAIGRVRPNPDQPTTIFGLRR